MTSRIMLVRVGLAAFVLAVLLIRITDRPGLAQTATRRVPEDYATIQAAIDAAQTDDIVLVAPGTYHGPLLVANKRIILASEFYTTQDPAKIQQTILDGQGTGSVVEIDPTASGTQVIGFTVQNAGNGILLRTHGSILNNIVRNTGDGIDGGNASGLIQGNIFENNEDDGVDFDAASSGIIEDNVMRHNGDDGFETRLHDYTGPQLTITLRGNTITGNGENGIQLIDYPGLSNRVYYIERNLIQGNAFVAIGLMDNGETREDYRGASIPERIHIFNNTLVGNPYAITGGDNLIALNNLIAGSSVAGLKNVDGASVAAHNLFWQNALNYTASNVAASSTSVADPLLDADYALKSGSPAIDAGTSLYIHNGETVLSYPPESYAGSAPDLGWREAGTRNDPDSTPTPDSDPHLPIILAAGDIATCAPDAVANRTAALLDSTAGTVVTLGDNAYTHGTAEEFTNCFGPTWGRHRARIKPVPGNHEYMTPGASGYFGYFGTAASPLDANCAGDCKGYYSYDLGGWHIVALNSEIDMGPDSAQVQWLRSDLAAHPTVCTLAYWHRPLFSSGEHGGTDDTQPMWHVLYEYRADVVLNAHDHNYERFAPQNPDGAPEAERGIRQFVVGTGGNTLRPVGAIQPNSEARDSATWGVLKLTLNATGYDWEFIPVAGQTFRDSGSSPCYDGRDEPAAPTATATPLSTPISTPTPPTFTPTPMPTTAPSITPRPFQREEHAQFFPLIS